MVDAALPKSDRVDLPDDDEIREVAEVSQRIVERTQADPEPPPAVHNYAEVAMSAADWKKVIQSLPALSPLVKRVLGAIRNRLETGDEWIVVSGSSVGWNALTEALLNECVCFDQAIKITTQVAKQTV